MRFKQTVALFVGALGGMFSSVWAAQCDIDQLRKLACGLSGPASAVADAQVTLAAQYMYGECVPADFQAASRWIRYAQANGHPDAHRLSAIWHRLWTLPSPGNGKIVESAAKVAVQSSVAAAMPTTPPVPPVSAEGRVEAAADVGYAVLPTRDDPLCAVAAQVPVQRVRAVAFSTLKSYRIDIADTCSVDAIDTFIASLHGAGVQVTRQNGELTIQVGRATAAGRHALLCATHEVADVDVACPPMPAREIERLAPNDAKARFPGAIAVWKVAEAITNMVVTLERVPGGVDPADFAADWRPPYTVLRRNRGGTTGAIRVSIWAEPTTPSASAQRCEIARVQADVSKPRAATPAPASVVCKAASAQACAICGATALPAPNTQGSASCK